MILLISLLCVTVSGLTTGSKSVNIFWPALKHNRQPFKRFHCIAFVEPVAKIGENLYSSLNDAIIAAVPVSEETVTINVLQDVTLG